MTTEQEIYQKKKYDTIPKLIWRNFDNWADDTAMCMKKFGIWEKYSWRRYYEIVQYFSLGLISLGLKKDDIVCIIGDNEPEWFWGEFAVQAARGIATGAFVDSIPSEVKYIAEHSGAKFAIVNDQEQTDKFMEIKDQLPALQKIIYWDPKGLKNYDDPSLIGFNEVLKLGREYETTHPDLFEQNLKAGDGDDIRFLLLFRICSPGLY
jgi:long-chain acyl-CoA synthetase